MVQPVSVAPAGAVAAALNRFACAAVTRANAISLHAGRIWTAHRPTTIPGWAALAGVSLLALSAISGIGCLLGAALLLWGWASLLTAAALLATATAVAAFAGTAALFLSAVLACMGTAVLSAAAGAYVAGVLLARLRSAGRAYLLLSPASAPNTQQAPPVAATKPAPKAVSPEQSGTSPDAPSCITAATAAVASSQVTTLADGSSTAEQANTAATAAAGGMTTAAADASESVDSGNCPDVPSNTTDQGQARISLKPVQPIAAAPGAARTSREAGNGTRRGGGA